MPATQSKNRSLSCIVLGTTLFLTGCPSKPTDICEGGESTCSENTYPFGCWNFWGVEIASCQEDLTDAHAWCTGQGGGSLAAYEIDCEEVGGNDEVGDSGWDPGEYVSNPSAGVYYVNFALVGQIKNDFNLLGNDSTILIESAQTDYFELSGVASGDLADVLGLQTGDILLSVNSYSLDGIDDAMTAFSGGKRFYLGACVRAFQHGLLSYLLHHVYLLTTTHRRRARWDTLANNWARSR